MDRGSWIMPAEVKQVGLPGLLSADIFIRGPPDLHSSGPSLFVCVRLKKFLFECSDVDAMLYPRPWRDDAHACVQVIVRTRSLGAHVHFEHVCVFDK